MVRSMVSEGKVNTRAVREFGFGQTFANLVVQSSEFGLFFGTFERFEVRFSI